MKIFFRLKISSIKYIGTVEILIVYQNTNLESEFDPKYWKVRKFSGGVQKNKFINKLYFSNKDK